jgi:hypothetical protein
MRNGEPAPGPLPDLEISSVADSPFFFHIDRASPRTIGLTFLTLSSFLLLHIVASGKAPGFLDNGEVYFPLNASNSARSLDLDYTMSELQDSHRFLDINCSLLFSHPHPHATSLSLAYTSRALFLTNFTVTNSVNSNEQTFNLTLIPGSRETAAFPVIRKEILGYDTAQLTLTITADFEGVTGGLFRWSFANPAAIQYSIVARSVVSALIGYQLLVYLAWLDWGTEFTTELFLIAIGILGILAGNPLYLFVSKVSSVCLSDHFFLSLFVAVFRLFCLLQVWVIRSQGKSAANPLLLVFLVAFFGVYAAVEAVTGLDHADLIAEAESWSEIHAALESVLIGFHLVYIVFSLVSLWMAAFSWKFAPKRLLMFVGFVGITLGATGFSQIYCIVRQRFLFTVIPSTVYSIAHMSCGAFLLFLMHSDRGVDYRPMKEEGEQGAFVADEATGEDDDVWISRVN